MEIPIPENPLGTTNSYVVQGPERNLIIDRGLGVKAHHNRRLDEVLSLLKSRPQTAFQLASCMTWNIKHASWDLFPLFEKIIAVGETVAHLAYLEKDDEVHKQVAKNPVMYSIDTTHGHGRS